MTSDPLPSAAIPSADQSAVRTVGADSLPRLAANHIALSPVEFLRRSVMVYPDKIAIVYGALRRSWRDTGDRISALASAIVRAGIQPGQTVSTLLPNTPAMFEAHFGVPGARAVLNTINTRLDAAAIAFILQHADTRLLLVDRALVPLALRAVGEMSSPPRIIWVDDEAAQDVAAPADSDASGLMEYEEFLATGDASAPLAGPADEWDTLALNYTSGTTGNPKGVLYSHRGAYLNALGNVITFGLSPDSVYLWTLPMFHCNGWTYPWAVTAVGARHVCLRNIDPGEIFRTIEQEKVTHLCGAPVVLSMLIHAPAEAKCSFSHGPVQVAVGGAAPPSTVIANMEKLGFRLTHLYGMTESYGPGTSCAWQEEWGSLSLEERAIKMSRQGVPNVTMSEHSVLDVSTGQPVPADGKTLGELVVRGNTVMKGYLKNPVATEEALRGGWLHTGDLAVMHPDHYVEIRDRAKDVIISGGENIASLEVEEVLYRHPDVVEAAVVARPDEKWGETPCAFVTLKPGAENRVSEADIIAFCRANLAAYKIPRTVIFGLLPKTSTGKIQKFMLRDHARQL